VLVALLVAAGGGVAVLWLRAIGGPVALRARYGTAGMLVAFVVHWALNLTPAGEVVPLAVINGGLWGFWPAVLVNLGGWTAASITQYAAVRWLGAGAGERPTLDRAPGVLRRLALDRAAFQILGRSVPWVGLHVVNVTAALLGVPFGRFVAYAVLGQAAPAVLMAAIGAGLARAWGFGV
jgi:uncharacterized membrane protein YdjX (TVP38/TMEM64 family)